MDADCLRRWTLQEVLEGTAQQRLPYVLMQTDFDPKAAKSQALKTDADRPTKDRNCTMHRRAQGDQQSVPFHNDCAATVLQPIALMVPEFLL